MTLAVYVWLTFVTPPEPLPICTFVYDARQYTVLPTRKCTVA